MASSSWRGEKTTALVMMRQERWPSECTAETSCISRGRRDGHGMPWQEPFPVRAHRISQTGRSGHQGPLLPKRDHTKSGRVIWARSVSMSVAVKYGIKSAISWVAIATGRSGQPAGRRRAPHMYHQIGDFCFGLLERPGPLRLANLDSTSSSDTYLLSRLSPFAMQCSQKDRLHGPT